MFPALNTLKGRLFIIVGLFLLIASCTSEVKPEEYQTQRTFFLNAIEQVNKAGQLLQQSKPSSTDIKQAMILLDAAMADVNSVESSFLKWLDAGLYQAFSAYLAKGIESYRLGVEFGNQEQQAKGIDALQKWWDFWQLKRPAILEKLDAKV